MRWLNTIRRALYRGARVAGDVQAATRGPGAIVRRAFRRAVLRKVGRVIR